MEIVMINLHQECRQIFHVYHANQEKKAKCLHHVLRPQLSVGGANQRTEEADQDHDLLAAAHLRLTTAAHHRNENVANLLRLSVIHHLGRSFVQAELVADKDAMSWLRWNVSMQNAESKLKP
jgi:hypothetical protein